MAAFRLLQPHQSTLRIERMVFASESEQAAKAGTRVEMAVGKHMHQQFGMEKITLDRDRVAQGSAMPRVSDAAPVHGAIEPRARTASPRWSPERLSRRDMRVEERIEVPRHMRT